MTQAMRPSTLETLGLGNVLEIFKRGGPPARLGELVDRVFGPAGERGALVVSGANGIVGAGKVMQLGSRLHPYGVPVVALDFPGAPDGIGRQYPGLQRAFGDQAAAIMSNVTRLSYDGKNLPSQLASFRPRFLLEAVPEILEIKRKHYDVFRAAFPGIEIRSVTSGFPQSALGVGITHPAFPHEINKVWETVESEPSAITQMLWAMGLIPLPVGDQWSFVLDVLFCGLTGAASRYHEASNMPFWKMDKYIRRLLGPNPLRAHDAIGAAGANFLTWSCLHHLTEHYGELFRPTGTMVGRKDSGANWYPLNHFRPLVDWPMAEGEETDAFHAWILGPIFQMTSLMLHEKRAHMTHMNSIGELCAQFTRGVLAVVRSHGADEAIRIVEAYHRLHPEAANKAWHPETFARIETPEWQQLYVNAEHDGSVGVISLAREAYNADVDAELNRAIDWLKSAGVDRVILTGDFHISTQMVGADTNEFFPALEDAERGVAISRDWSATARRLHDDFRTSVGFIGGKRALGGMLELMAHCHYLVAVESAGLGFPEVTLPVVPGMEGCHWPFRKASAKDWPRLMELLLTGRPVRAKEAIGWLVDYAGSMDESIQTAWKIAAGGDHGFKRREFAANALDGIDKAVPDLPAPGGPGVEAGRRAILDCIRSSCAVPVADAIDVQSKHSGAFMSSKDCMRGVVGGVYRKTVKF